MPIRESIHPVYNGVDPESFVACPSEPSVPTLVWLGRIDPLKDVETLIRSFAKVRQAIPTARLRIFGGASTENQGYLDTGASHSGTPSIWPVRPRSRAGPTR